jgi:hypothetical protein
MSDTLQALIIDDTEANRSFFERLITQLNITLKAPVQVSTH